MVLGSPSPPQDDVIATPPIVVNTTTSGNKPKVDIVSNLMIKNVVPCVISFVVVVACVVTSRRVGNVGDDVVVCTPNIKMEVN